MNWPAVHEDVVSKPPVSAGAVIVVAVWFGLVSGIIEAAINAFRKFAFGQFMVMNWQFPWMIPLAAVLLFLFLGICTIPLARWRWVPFGREAAILGLGFVAFWGPVRAIPGLATYAVNLVALGLAVQVGRLNGWQISTLYGFARRTIAVLGGSVAAVMTVMLLAQWVGESSAIARLATAPANAPNVILVVLDTVRDKDLSAYGYARPTTPALERLAAAGATFERALAAAPWTLPSHASLFTGTYPHEHGADWSKPLNDRLPTLAEALQARGYATAGFSANTLNVTRAHGLSRGFIHFEDLPVSVGRLALSTSIGRMIVSQGTLRHWLGYHEVADRQPAGTVTNNALSWLRTHSGRPFFVFMNFFDAHDPYLPPDPFATKFGPRRSAATRFWHTGVAAWPVDRETMSPAAKQAEIDAYDGAIAYMDAQLDRIIAFLQERHLSDHTLLIVTSDHGEQLGEHGLFNHGNSLYRPVLQVPLVMSFPGRIQPGLRIAQPVSLRDIPRTVIDLIVGTGPNVFPGLSLAPYCRGEAMAVSAEPVFIEGTRRPFGTQSWYPLLKGDMRSVVADGFEYIRNGDGTEELYDFDHDVDETTNLVHSPAHAAVLEKMRRLLIKPSP